MVITRELHLHLHLLTVLDWISGSAKGYIAEADAYAIPAPGQLELHRSRSL